MIIIEAFVVVVVVVAHIYSTDTDRIKHIL